MVWREAILRNELLERLCTLTIALRRDVGATKLVPRIVDIVAYAIRHDTLQAVNLARLLILDTIDHSHLVVGIVALLDGSIADHIIGLAGILKLTRSEVGITQAVMGIVEVVVTHIIVAHKGLEGTLRLDKSTRIEVGIASAVVGIVVLHLAPWCSTDIVLVALQRLSHIAVMIRHLALPIERQGVVLRHKADILRLLEQFLGNAPFTSSDSGHSTEYRNALQYGTQVVIGILEVLDSRIGSIVVRRIIERRNEKSLHLSNIGRLRIALQVALQHIYSLIEKSTTELVLQAAIVQECIFGNLAIEAIGRRHSKGIGSVRLVAHLKVAVTQVVRGVLRQGIIGTTHLREWCDSVVVAGKAV